MHNVGVFSLVIDNNGYMYVDILYDEKAFEANFDKSEISYTRKLRSK